MGEFQISRFLVDRLNKYCCNSNDIDTKLGPVTKIDKETWQCQKNLTMTSCQQIWMSLSFLEFMADLKQSKSWILDVWPAVLTFYLTATFFILQKLKTELKKI